MYPPPPIPYTHSYPLLPTPTYPYPHNPGSKKRNTWGVFGNLNFIFILFASNNKTIRSFRKNRVVKFLFSQVQTHVDICIDTVYDIMGVRGDGPYATLDSDTEIVILAQH